MENSNKTINTNCKVTGNIGWLKTIVPCDRCHATGRLPQYNHIEGGICFKCRGAKQITISYKIAA